MLGEHHNLAHEFPDHIPLIHQLISDNNAFAENTIEYNQLDYKIRDLETSGSPVTDETLSELKKQRAKLKDLIYTEIKRHTVAAH